MKNNLLKEFERIKANHHHAIRHRAARVVLAPSVIRVFERGTKDKLFAVLVDIPIEELAALGGEDQFRVWFESQLDALAEEMKQCNFDNSRIYPGYKWGHATKVLTLYIRELVLNSRYFSDSAVKRITPWLYAPVDSIAIRRLRQLGMRLPFKQIKEIDSSAKFYGVQDLLGQAAEQVGVPRIWFDDNWGDRQ